MNQIFATQKQVMQALGIFNCLYSSQYQTNRKRTKKRPETGIYRRFSTATAYFNRRIHNSGGRRTGRKV